MPPVRILLVEDNDIFRDAFQIVLEDRTDVQVVAAVGDGSQAVPAAEQYRPDVVLMDYRLPNMDGVQATTALKAAYPEIPVVVLTASANPREIEALYAAGATTCLTKAEPLETIIETIKQAVAA